MSIDAGLNNLVLAGYNAGEGAVIRYGQTIPPHKETKTTCVLSAKATSEDSQ